MFDLDYSGHYLRRLKSVCLTIPCVTGPYTGVSCTLTLLRSSVRFDSTVSQGYARTEDDARFTENLGTTQSIVTSSGQNDSGLFETDLRDERYLPFERAGAISTWRLEMPATFRLFDNDTIADVVLHVRYTARDGGASVREKCVLELRQTLNLLQQASGGSGLARLFSLRHEFPTEWARLTNAPVAAGKVSQSFMVTRARFPFLFAARATTITVTQARLYAVPKASVDDPEFPSTLSMIVPRENTATALGRVNSLGRLAHKSFDKRIVVADSDAGATWKLEISDTNDAVAGFRARIDDVLMVLRYEVSAAP
jgi:hypothetical protein